MSKSNTKTNGTAAAQREALIRGQTPSSPSDQEWIKITERHGQRWLHFSHISQVICDAGQIGGPWFVRCDGQQHAVTEAVARDIMQRLGVPQ